MSRPNRLKLQPLPKEDFKLLTSQAKEDYSYKRILSKQPRFKTEVDQEAIFPLFLSEGRRHATSEKDPRKEYELFRQLQLRKDFESRGTQRKRPARLFRPSKDSASIVGKLDQKLECLPKSVEVNDSKGKDLCNNVLRLARVLTAIFRKEDASAMVLAVKEYVLQEESDLGDLQAVFQEGTRLAIKQGIYYQRVALILLVESILTRKFKADEAQWHQLCRDIIHFYCALFQLARGEKLNTFLVVNNHKYLSQHAPSISPFSLSSIKDRLSKRVTALTKHHAELQRFVGSELARLTSLPTNLLYYNLLQFYAGRLVGQEWGGWGIQFLQTCPSPYLHHPAPLTYTLLLDLDETLVHYRVVSASKGEFLLRPFLFEFLRSLQGKFEVGVFTCALKDYADAILEHLPGVSIRLYRQHAVRMGKELVKDLSRVGRDPCKLILVDNLSKNFQLQPQNGIHVKSWYGDPQDTVLKHLQEQLLSLLSKNPDDVRQADFQRSFL